ncbi:hypothetical protein D050_0488A, partial [Vibrio parahaemolyticus VPCR-2009]
MFISSKSINGKV